jgi:uncharacterized protein
MTKGVLLRIFMLEGQRHHGELLYDWLLRRAREMGITGGAAFREIAGYGRHERLHEQFFFELAGDLPVEVVFAMTQSDSQKFLDLLAREKLSLFYISSPCEFGHVGEWYARTARDGHQEGTAALYFWRKIGVKTAQGMAWNPLAEPAKRNRVVPCLDLEDETG